MYSRNLLLVGLLAFPLYADLSIGQMEIMVKKIRAKRIGKIDSNITVSTSPFVQIQKEDNITIMIEEKVIKKEVGFTLGGIMNDKAYINQKWVEKGESIEGYTLMAVDSRSVSLVKDKHTIKVFLKKSKHILQLSEG